MANHWTWTDLQPASRASTRLVAKRSDLAPAVLNLKPLEDELASDSRKRPHSDVQHEDRLQLDRLNALRASPSSLSSLSSPDDDRLNAPKPAKRARAKSDVTHSEHGEFHS